MKNWLTFLVSMLLIVSCTPKKSADQMTDEELTEYAKELAHRFIITDGHIDFPWRLQKDQMGNDDQTLALSQSDPDGEFDHKRAKEGGLDAPFMSIYIPSSYQQREDMGFALADSLIDGVRYIAEKLPDFFALAGSPQEVENNFKKGIISLPMGMENGAPIGLDLKNVQHFFDRGIRYITLTHAKDNQFCDSSYDTTHTHNGLSELGKSLVAVMNRVGIMVDISHVDDSTFYQVMQLTDVPCIASHSSCRHFTPGFERNMSDDMIALLAKKGGVIQINFGSGFLDGASRDQSEKDKAELKALLQAQNLSQDDEAAKPIIEAFWKEHLYRFSDVEKVADHIDHVVEIAGIDHVGLGSDFDGVGNSLPEKLKDVSQYPNLIVELLKRNYSEEDIEKVCYKNVWRVWNSVLDAAKEK